MIYAKAHPLDTEADWIALVRSISQGDEAALHALYGRTNRLVFTLTMRMTANREMAEELTLDVFHGVWRRAAQFDPDHGTVLGWIMNQARSRALDRLRFENRKKRVMGATLQPLADTSPDPTDVLEMQEQARRLRSAMSALTLAERHAIEMTFFSGLTHAEAAARLEQPLGTIKTRIRSGLHKLRRALTEEPGSE